jgi:4-aminobutyrate aminotransferase-like enzyme
VVREFGHDQRYFNTFGGNTVAIAAAQATLDVVRDEQLLDHAAKVGAAISDGLHELATRHAAIGDIRGAGLYLGVEIVRDRDSKSPDTATAAALVNGLRDRHVLISATGFHGNVLKIRPPLVFTDADADRLLSALDDTLARLGTTPRRG